MNEVKTTNAAASYAAAVVTSSKGAAETRGGKELPQVPEQPVKEEPKQVDSVQLEQAVTELNDYVQKVERDLQFSVDEDLGRTVVKVVDRESGELIRQIPDQSLLEIARGLRDTGRLSLVNAQG